MTPVPPHAEPLDRPPVRACCGTRHYGVICPDQTFMCCLCFEKIPVDDAWRDAGGQGWDVCRPCGEREEG